MRRTNEEFRAEVFRRKEVYLKARKKRIFGAVLCMPLCLVLVFAGLSFSMGMRGMGSAAPGGDGGGNMYKDDPAAGRPTQEYSIAESDTRYGNICAFLAEVTARGAEDGDFEWDLEKDFIYKLFLGAHGEAFYVNKAYIFDGENTFSLKAGEYEKLRDIINYDGGEYYEK